MEAAGMQLPGRRKERAGEVDSPNLELAEEEEEEEEEDEDEEQLRNPGSSDEDEKESDQEMDELRAQVLQLLEELEETREIALKQEEDSLQLQGLLEDERLASAYQAEIFTKQIQRLQAQLHSLKDEYDSLQEGKDAEHERLEQELREVNEENHNLRLDAEEAAALHENEIAGLQEELCRQKAEVERMQHMCNEYELELTSLRAEITMKELGTGDSQPPAELMVVTHYDDRIASASEDVIRLQEELQSWKAQFQDLNEEYQILQESNNIMVHQLERLEAMKYRSRSKLDDSPSFVSESEENTQGRVFGNKRNSLHGAGSVSFKSVEIVGYGSEYDEEKHMSMLEEESSSQLLQLQLKTEEEKAEAVQAQEEAKLVREEEGAKKGTREAGSEERKVGESAGWRKCNQAQEEVRELERKYKVSREEWERLQEELRLCKEEIERLNGNIPAGGRIPAGGLKPIALFVALAGGLLLYPCLKRWSGTSLRT
ncbi:coiled-coil domain-containing protein 136 isoform X1 [Eublepharis macularius]|uniref:Coiled-coil domain-containing protein 136 isoform X1 n=1 Tax=Eublepharis macularius TaxID=481883 RepID=A0AA97JWY1_EUBMA|nr:coiled-coil domain-containing protein 136 isoform X1 [Eublepharis macularius]